MGLEILEPGRRTAAEARAQLCALTIMAKAPRPGEVKTRLSPPLTAAQATALSIAFLRDTAEDLAAAEGGAGVISYTPIGEERRFEGVVPANFALIPQRGTGFGERLLYTAQDLFVCGFATVCLIDSDSPTVPPEAYRQAVDALARPGDRIVLGPTADGGYYLLGLKHPHAELFREIDWSTPAVYTQTLDRAAALGLEVVELPLWYDVDDAASLKLLRTELLGGIAPGFALQKGYAAPHTRAALLEIDLALNTGKSLAPDAGGAADTPVDQHERPGLLQHDGATAEKL